MVAAEAWDDLFLHGLDDVEIAGSVDEEEHGEFAVDFGDMAFEDDFGEDGADGRFALDVFEELGVCDADAKLDGVEVAGGVLAETVLGEVDIGVVGQDAIAFEFGAFAADGAGVDAGFFADGVIGLARVADELADDFAFLFVEIAQSFLWGGGIHACVSLGLSACEEGFEGAAEEGVDVALDVLGGGNPARASEVFVFFGEDFGEDGSGVGPFVTELVHDAAVAMLGGDVEAEEFDAHAGDFFDEGGVVEEPPAAEDVEIGEFSCGDAERVLVFAGEHRADEAVFWEGVADIFDGDDVRGVEAVACHFEGWVHVASDADHHGEGLSVIGAVGEDGFGEDAIGDGVGGESPVWGEGDHGVGGFDAFCPIGEEAFDFVEGFAGEIGGNLVAPGREFGRGIFPVEQERIDSEGWGEGGVDGGVFVPVSAFGVVEGQVGHADAAHFCLFENHVGEGVWGPLGEAFPDAV